MSTASVSRVFVFAMLFCLASGCHNLPPVISWGAREYLLQQRMECKGGKVYDIENVQDVEQCKEACRRFDCDAVNLFQLGEFEFKCEILSYVNTVIPAQGAACYYASDMGMGGGGYGGGWGMFGRRR